MRVNLRTSFGGPEGGELHRYHRLFDYAGDDDPVEAARDAIRAYLLRMREEHDRLPHWFNRGDAQACLSDADWAAFGLRLLSEADAAISGTADDEADVDSDERFVDPGEAPPRIDVRDDPVTVRSPWRAETHRWWRVRQLVERGLLREAGTRHDPDVYALIHGDADQERDDAAWEALGLPDIEDT